MLTFHYATLENLLDWSFFKQTNPKEKPWCGNGVFGCGKVKTNFQCVNPTWEQRKNTRHIFRNMSDLFQNISDIFFIPRKPGWKMPCFILPRQAKLADITRIPFLVLRPHRAHLVMRSSMTYKQL